MRALRHTNVIGKACANDPQGLSKDNRPEADLYKRFGAYSQKCEFKLGLVHFIFRGRKLDACICVITLYGITVLSRGSYLIIIINDSDVVRTHCRFNVCGALQGHDGTGKTLAIEALRCVEEADHMFKNPHLTVAA